MKVLSAQKSSSTDTVNWLPGEILAWKPKDRITISAWAEAYRVLGMHSEEQGKYNLQRAPYFRHVMDMVMEPDVLEIILCKSAQIGGTDAFISVMGYYSHQEPCPILLVMADEATADYMGRERLQRMFRDSPKLTPLIGPIFNKQEIKLINGGYISTAWASSVAGLGSRSFKIVIGDEIDKPGYYTKSKEGDSLSLIRQRPETFFGGKIMFLSTPTLDTGNVTLELESCDIIYDWHVPCPFCRIKQPLRWSREYTHGFKEGQYRGEDGKYYPFGQVVWEGGREATQEQLDNAGYECGSCGKLWTTVQKNLAVEQGKMIARSEPGQRIQKVGYHINRLYSLLGNSGSIPKLVKEWIRCILSRIPKKIQGFVNNALAEPWTQAITKTTEGQILKAKCDLTPQLMPEQAIALTCGIDVQSYGFWFVVRAWARDFENWLIHYGLLNTWADVEALLFKSQYPVEGKEGQSRRIWRAAVDTGGGLYVNAQESTVSMTEETYFWIRKNGIGRGARVWGTKGAARPMETKVKIGKRIDQTPSGKPLLGGIQIVSLDTGQLKDMYHYRLNLAVEGETGPMVAHLHKETGEDYAKQITAEEKRIEDGLPVWVQIRTDNHLFDAEVLCMSCAEPEWPGGGVNLIAPEEPPKKEEPKQQPFIPRKEGWL